MLYLFKKQAYKFKLLKKLKIDKVFYVLLLKHNIHKKSWLNENRIAKFDASNNEKYKIKAIWDNAIYVKKLASNHLPKLYYLLLIKYCLEKKNL